MSEQYALFIGRFSPFHKGHEYIIRQALDAGEKVLIAIRDTPVSEKDPYTVYERAAMLKTYFQDEDVKVIMIPDITSVNIGRKVGYEVNRYDVPPEIAGISATEIRSAMKSGDPSWQSKVHPEIADSLSELMMERFIDDHKEGSVIWLTGLPCSGKTTIARELGRRLKSWCPKLLDGDQLRRGLCSDLGFSPKDRAENIRRVSHLATALADLGSIVIASFVSPYHEIRNRAAEIIGKSRFYEVYVKCPVPVCEWRDVKGMYAKAREGKILGFTGIDATYEEPVNPLCTVDTDRWTLEACARTILCSLGGTCD